MEIEEVMLKIILFFMLIHSHCDPGWLKTYEEYYKEDVKIILSNVMTQLKIDSKKRFIWSDISFWIPWWNEQTIDIQELVRGFIKNGQLEVKKEKKKLKNFLVCKWWICYS